MDQFIIHSKYKPTGDQPQAIEKLVSGIKNGEQGQVLLGVTGSGKTFTMANVIARVNRPTLVLAHNKTLAAQLCSEFREIFPENAVEYFVSYYDYYQPEAYIPGRDQYIEKDAMINEDIDRLRHSATSALFERRDVIIVSSVSCIYSLGDPEEYAKLVLAVRPGMAMDRDEFISRLVEISYDRNDLNLVRDRFRVRGDIVEVFPANSKSLAVRVEFFDDVIDRVSEIDTVTQNTVRELRYAAIYPATHYAVSEATRVAALGQIEAELEERTEFFRSCGKLLEAQRIEERTRYDLEMMQEIGYCSGVENYSRILAGRAPGSTPSTLMDYFPKDFLMFIDESHVTLPQVHAMSGGDRKRKENLVEYGFRLPSAYDNRPLSFSEFEKKLNQVVFVSATPSEYEKTHSSAIVEQLIRPTGLIDPEVEVRPVEGQVDDLIGEIRERAARNERVLVTTLTTKMAEDLTEFLSQNLIKVRYIHHNVETIERMEIIRDLRLGLFDVLVGINLLREGLDIPEVSLVAILDADKEGLLRSETALIQTIGRAARNAGGKVIMYADVMTGSMTRAIGETNRRRKIQQAYNEEHGITPQTIVKAVNDIIEIGRKDENRRAETLGRAKTASEKLGALSSEEKNSLIEELTSDMKTAAAALDFERAAYLRDKIETVKNGTAQGERRSSPVKKKFGKFRPKK